MMKNLVVGSESKRPFFPHLQGLRGLAIVLIVLFHMLPGVWKNGYMGVDVFLVLSGYLLIGKQLQNDSSFDFYSFLRGKVLRIIPPVLVLIALSLLACIALFPAQEMLAAAKLTKAVLLGYGNQYLSERSADYFSANTRLLPIMHFWYIGVLLQSFLIFGGMFFLWNLCHIGKKVRIISLVALGALSFSFFTPGLLAPWGGYESAFYYCTVPRLWEFALGGLLVLLPVKKYVRVWGGAALAALIVVVVFSKMGLPSVFASLSGFGDTRNYILMGAFAGALLVGAGNHSLCSLVLNCFPFQWLGRISYSLYLIHWPVICFIEYIRWQRLGYYTGAVVCVIVIVAAFLFWRMVESKKISLRNTVALWLLAGVGVTVILSTDGLSHFVHQEANQVKACSLKLEAYPLGGKLYDKTQGLVPDEVYRDLEHPEQLLHVIGSNQQRINFAVIGDSHANNLAHGLQLLSQQYSWNGVFMSAYIVPFWGAEYSWHIKCMVCRREHQEALLRWLEQHSELHYVLIAQRWSVRFGPHMSWETGDYLCNEDIITTAREAQLRRFCEKLKNMGKEVIIFTDTPSIGCLSPGAAVRSHIMFSPSSPLPNSLFCTKEQYERSNGKILSILQRLESAGLCRVLHRETACFEHGVFPAYDADKNRLNYSDADHFTPDGASAVLSSVANELQSILQQ